MLVLHLLEKHFDGGNRWLQGALTDGNGRHCLYGGVAYIRTLWRIDDRTEAYLCQAISQGARRLSDITAFNDRQDNYTPVHEVIVRARELAAADANRGVRACA